MNKEKIINNCKRLLHAYKNGRLGQTIMPEDSNPGFSDNEEELRLAYFTLPMALNYQRDSYKLWESALKTYNDEETKEVFDVKKVSLMNEDELRKKLMKYKLALQPNKHIQTWSTISKTIERNFGSIKKLFQSTDNDYLQLRIMIQNTHKKGFPYLSGPKIFNYWSFIMKTYGNIPLQNSHLIEIAPDTHVTQCSVKLGVINNNEAETLSKGEISDKWRELLKNTEINPIDMHPPLWFWSRNGFIYNL